MFELFTDTQLSVTLDCAQQKVTLLINKLDEIKKSNGQGNLAARNLCHVCLIVHRENASAFLYLNTKLLITLPLPFSSTEMAQLLNNVQLDLKFSINSALAGIYLNVNSR